MVFFETKEAPKIPWNELICSCRIPKVYIFLLAPQISILGEIRARESYVRMRTISKLSSSFFKISYFFPKILL